MTKFRKKPVVIEAVQWDGRSETIFPLAPFENASAPPAVAGDKRLHITTLEGVMAAEIGDWIIKGVKGEIYPCKPDIFAATYEPVTVRLTDADADADLAGTPRPDHPTEPATREQAADRAAQG